MIIDKINFFVLYIISLFMIAVISNYISLEPNYTIMAIVSLVLSLKNE